MSRRPGLYRNGVWQGQPDLPCKVEDGDTLVGLDCDEKRWMTDAEYISLTNGEVSEPDSKEGE